MNTILFYYTGTGNSLWVARTVSKEFGDTEVVSIPDFKGDPGIVNNKTIGIVFPVHMWGVPRPVLQFITLFKGNKPAYLFAIAVNAGQVANTLVQLKKACLRYDLALASGIEVTMPSNYIPWGGPGPVEKQTMCFTKAREKIIRFAKQVKEKKKLPVEKGPLWQRILFSGIYAMSFPHILKMDRAFQVDEKCNHCTLCRQVCPANNITMDKGTPVWNHRCEQCFACLQWCPACAIQYGKKTHLYERYHQPEVGIKDMIRKNGALFKNDSLSN